MIDYNPEDAVRLWPEGEYDAVIAKATHEYSKAQKPMYAMEFRVYRGEETMIVRDWISIPAAVWKLKDLAVALNRLSDFETRQFTPEDYVGANLRIKLKVVDNKEYGEQNRVDGYEPAPGANPSTRKPVAQPVQEVPPDDDIPF